MKKTNLLLNSLSMQLEMHILLFVALASKYVELTHLVQTVLEEQYKQLVNNWLHNKHL